MYEDITPEKIKNEMIDEIGTQVDTGEGTFINDMLSAVSKKIWDTYQDFNDILEIVFMKTSDGEYAIKKAEEEGLYLMEGTKAIGKLLFTGVCDTVIPVNTICQTESGLTYFTTEESFIDISNEVLVEAMAISIGNKYNVPAESITLCSTKISGVTSVTNPERFEGGTDEETVEELKKRYFEKKRSAPTSGNIDYYKHIAKTVEGVYNVRVIPIWNGNGTVKVILVGKDNTTVNSAIIDKVSKVVEENKPIGADVTVESVKQKQISVYIEFYETCDDASSVKSNIKTAIENYFKSFDKSTVYANKIISVAVSESGIEFIKSLTLNGGTSVKIAANEVPFLSELTLNEEIEL